MDCSVYITKYPYLIELFTVLALFCAIQLKLNLLDAAITRIGYF